MRKWVGFLTKSQRLSTSSIRPCVYVVLNYIFLSFFTPLSLSLSFLPSCVVRNDYVLFSPSSAEEFSQRRIENERAAVQAATAAAADWIIAQHAFSLLPLQF